MNNKEIIIREFKEQIRELKKQITIIEHSDMYEAEKIPLIYNIKLEIKRIEKNIEKNKEAK